MGIWVQYIKEDSWERITKEFFTGYTEKLADEVISSTEFQTKLVRAISES